jgi:hypothetical protein
MSYFARIDENNNVIDVIVADQSFVNSGAVGDWSEWKECSRDGSIRKNMPGVGYTYDPARDAFIPPKPHDSWVIDEDTCKWKAPVDKPDDGNRYSWDEVTTSWTLAENEE